MPKLNLAEQEKETLAKIGILKKASQCLMPLSAFIERNYDYFLRAILHFKGHLTKLQFHHHEMIRLILGLNFY